VSDTVRPRSLSAYKLTEPMRLGLLYLLDRRLGEFPGSPATWRALAERKLAERFVTSSPGYGRFYAMRLTNEGRRIARLLKESA
jgi:hypothetical protein